MRTFNVRAARVAMGVSQVQLAALSGMAVNTLSKLENHEQVEWPKKTIGALLRLADVLGVEPLSLYPALSAKQEKPNEPSS